MIPVESDGQRIQLETTIFKPDGDGPFPLAIINHAKSKGLKPRNHERARYLAATREFIRRGYVVALPMRQGFSKSTGSYVDTECNIEWDGQIQAGNVVGIINYLKRKPYVDKDRIIVVGYSSGGLVALATGARNIPGVHGLINFAGGIRVNECDDWVGSLVWAVTRYARHTRVPSLWLYGENDNVFPPYVVDRMYQRYTQAGGMATLVRFGKFGDDAHLMFGTADGLPIWLPDVEKFLQSLGLPHKPIPPEYGELLKHPEPGHGDRRGQDNVPNARAQ
jgi:dienelactone hydrolase